MIRTILGIIAGFVAWSIVWLGSDALMGQVWPSYAAFQEACLKAMTEGTTLNGDPLIYIANLVRSFVTSIIAGYIAALVAGEYRRSTVILGVILLLVGGAVEFGTWNLAPAWYHITFLLFLIPMTVLGGRLRRSA